MPNRTTRWCAGAALALLFATGAGCSSDTTTTSAPATSSPGTSAPTVAVVTVRDAWARTSPMASTLGAAYLTLESNVGDVLIGASVPSSVAARTEIHETVMASPPGTAMTGTSMDESTDPTMGDDEGSGSMGSGSAPAGGEMEMRPITELALPAGETVELKPGGYHLMLLDLVAPLEQGTTIEITLTFEKAGEQVVSAMVRDG